MADAKLPLGMQHNDVLATALSQLLTLGHTLALAPVLAAPEDHAVSVAERLNLLQRQQVHAGRGVPGQLVVMEDQPAMKTPATSYKFYEGEIVAVPAEESRNGEVGSWIYAEIEEPVKMAGDGGVSASSNVQIDKVLVRIGPTRVRQTFAALVKIFASVELAVAPDLAVDDDRTRIGGICAAAARGDGSGQIVDGEPEPKAEEEQAQFLETVNNLLRRAGLPAQAESMQLMNQVLSLQRELEVVSLGKKKVCDATLCFLNILSYQNHHRQRKKSDKRIQRWRKLKKRRTIWNVPRSALFVAKGPRMVY